MEGQLSVAELRTFAEAFDKPDPLERWQRCGRHVLLHYGRGLLCRPEASGRFEPSFVPWWLVLLS